MSDNEIELILLPYGALTGRTVLHVLIEELNAGRWSHFQAAIAFARPSGNIPELLDALAGFADAGGKIDLTFGADIFSGDNPGSDYAAVEEILGALNNKPTARVFLYHEKGRSFHPKLYMFSDEKNHRALLLVGSSNWSKGGFYDNVEANVILRLDLRREDHRQCFDDVQECFEQYWSESDER